MHLFSNMIPYRLAEGWAMTPGSLEEVLAKQPLMEPSGLSLVTRGWVPPFGEAQLVASEGRRMMIALGIYTKQLPASVINQHVKKAADELEQKQNYRPGRKQLRDIKERVIAELLPRALAKRSTVRAFIDPNTRWLVVDATSANKAEELLEQLRNGLGELPATRLETELSPQGAMTQWLTLGKATRDFALDSECELKGTGDDGATVRYLRHDLSVKEIREHIGGGKLATRCGLVWRERASLILSEPFAIKRVKSLLEKSQKEESDFATPEQQFEADFILNAAIVNGILADLVEAFGGEKK